MKKFFEKYDLVKLSGILIVLSIVLTWIVPMGYFQGTELTSDGLTRIGLFNAAQYSLLGMYYFTVLVTFLFVTGGFYQVLSKRPGYQKLIKNISEKLKGCEIPTVLVSSLLFAILTSLMNEPFALIALVPFIIAILNRMKVDKISAFIATFGGILVGTIGSTFSTKVAGGLVTNFGIEAADVLTTQTILFVIAFILFAAFAILRLRKQDKKDFKEYDLFAEERIENKGSKKDPVVWGYAIGITLFAILTILGYMPWGTWEITVFDDIATALNEFSIAGVPILTYIFGDFVGFGTTNYSLFQTQYIMMIGVLIVAIVAKVSTTELIEEIGLGLKKISKVVVIFLLVYMLMTFSYTFPVLPTIVNWLDGLTKNFNALIAYLNVFITSILTPEMNYVFGQIGSYYSAAHTEVLNELVIIFQSAFGFAQFFVPSSAVLMVGLAYIDIPYKDWMKHIWKYLLAMLVISIIIILVIV